MSVETAQEHSSFGAVIRQMNKMADQLSRGYYNFCPNETWTPAVNLYEHDRGYLVCVDLSGVQKEKIDIELIDQRLMLKGHRQTPMPPAPGHPADGTKSGSAVRIHLMEIDNGAFCREVELPSNVDRQRITATYDNGLLWIDLPKTPG